MTSPWIGLFAIATTTACSPPQYCEGDWAAAPPEAAPTMSRARTVAQVLPAESQAIDILFVIDDSSSMTDEQEQLGIWSKELFDVLSLSGELPDLHIAVTSSSLSIPGVAGCESGTGGALHVGTAELERASYIRDVATESGRDRNYEGSLTETFAKMARVGDSGCGFEQPFKAARAALGGYAVGGEGFLRDEALLLVVFVTDEDDCSARNSALFTGAYADACSELGTATGYRCFEHGVRCFDGKGSREFGDRKNCHPDESSQYVESVVEFGHFLKKLKPNPAQLVVAAIYGKPNGITAIPDERFDAYLTPRLADVCGGNGKEGIGATPAIRMNALMAEFGGRASHSSICESELSWAMRDAGLVTRAAATRSHCLHGTLIDGDAIAPGIQPTCRVHAVNGERGVELPACEGGTRARCFTLETDPSCATATQLAFRVAGSAGDETLTVTCDVDLDADVTNPTSYSPDSAQAL